MKKVLKTAIHPLLFLLTLFTTMLAGAELTTAKSWLGTGDARLYLSDLSEGLTFSIAFLAFLTFHEFGHYFTALYHRVKCSLPYYIPVFIPGVMNIGSFGAVIRLRSIPATTRKFFDIGVAGPYAGFVVSLFLLFYGFTHLPDRESYILELHPEYQEEFGGVPDREELKATYGELPFIGVGTSLLFEFCKWALVDDPSQIPPDFELMHYPFLFVGFITLFFTALNLLPIGQLDGGHVIYGLFGRRIADIVSKLAVLVLIFVGGVGAVDFSGETSWWWLAIYTLFIFSIIRKLFQNSEIWKIIAGVIFMMGLQAGLNILLANPNTGLIWLIYSFLLVNFMGTAHPPAAVEHELSTGRKLLAWGSIFIFILCFTPIPVYQI